MKPKTDLFPKVAKLSNGKFQVYFWYKGKRFRYANGNPIEQDISPNLFEGLERVRKAHMLCSAYTLAIDKGWRPTIETAKVLKLSPLRLMKVADAVLKQKLQLNYSDSYKKDLLRTYRLFSDYLKEQCLESILVTEVNINIIKAFVYDKSPSAASMKNLKRNISSLLKDELESQGVILNFKRIKLPRTTQELHKPIKDVEALLKDIAAFNDNLYLCALMTYGLLLRPHREVLSLRRGDFNDDFTMLSLDGSRVKSKRNRVLPVPNFVRKELIIRYVECDCEMNLFSRSRTVYHRDYFKNRWAEYKKESNILEKGQTLYSLRHSASIKVFEKTGSLQKLQQVMGHSDLKVSLTYLRSLEIKQIDVEDLPTLI
jgi:site-specific recombinase XerD